MEGNYPWIGMSQGRINLRQQEKEIWGKIAVAVLGEARTTSQISFDIRVGLSETRRELILMHHFDLIRPIGYKEDGSRGGYFMDLLWDLTPHSLYHSDSHDACRGCRIRDFLILSTPR